MSKKVVKEEVVVPEEVVVETTPVEVAPVETTPAKSEGSEIARAIAEGLKGATEKNFKLEPDAGVMPRFSVVKNKQGEILLRDNGDGTLSKIQMQSLEEKEASIQNQEVEEV